MEKERVIIFVDGSNLYHALKARFGKASIDFHKFSQVLAGPHRRLVRTYYYSAAYPRTHSKAQDQQKFFAGLQKTNYLQLRLGELQPRAGGLVQKGVDVHMAVQMIEYAVKGTCDVLILVSGDSDFVPAIQLVKDLGKHVEIAVVEGQPSFEIQKAGDKTIIINDGVVSCCWK